MTSSVYKTPEKKGVPQAGSPLPREKMPECWNEDQRMNALFSPFRSKSANPQDWISKYKFWKNILYEFLRHSMCCNFSIMELNEAFKRKGCSPLCLKTVVEELFRDNVIMLEEEFLKEPSETWTGWSLDIFVKKPFSWSVSKLKNYVVGSEININTKYVHLEIVKELSDIILSTIENKDEGMLIPIIEIVNRCKRITNNENFTEYSIKLALIWLKRNRKAAFRSDVNATHHELLVKLSSQMAQPVTEAEEALHKLLKQEDQLVKEIEFMEKEKLNIINTARSCLTKELREVAKTHLRKKVELEKTIEKRANALQNLRVLISSIQDTHSNTAILAAYKTGSDVLRKSRENELHEDIVREVMDDVSEALEDHKELQSTLAEVINNEYEEAELEKELEELLEQEEAVLPEIRDLKVNSDLLDLETRLKKLTVEDLPSPPSSQFIVSKNKQKQSLQAETA